MSKLFDNLFLYEIVLLFLGVFLFMLLCAGLVYFIVKKDDLKKLLFFFPIPIIMIAYPSIQEIQIEKDKFALRKFTDKVIENPMDSIAQTELNKVTYKLEKRATNIEDIQAVSEANLVLGNSEKVIELTDKIIEEEKLAEAPIGNIVSEELRESRNKVNVLKDIRQVAKTQNLFKTNPEIVKDTAKLREQINKIEWKNPKTVNYLKAKISKQLKLK